MKNTLSVILAIALTTISSLPMYGQHCSMTADKVSPVSLRIKSIEFTSLTGQVTIQVVVKAIRKIYFPSLPYLDGQFSDSLFSEEPNNNSYAAPDTLEAGDSLTHSITLNYDQNNLPYYPADVVLAFNDSLKRKAKLYFTPYNSLEVWDIGDYTTLNRTWIDPKSVETSPTRISVSQSSIPVSDLPSSGEVADDVAIYTVNVPGLAYSIPMLQPDTFNWDTGVIYSNGGSSMYKADGCGFWGHRFNGRISNLRLTSLHIPDGPTFNVSDAVDIGLRDLEVDICVNRWPNQVIMECTTDDEGFLVDGNGSRTIDFDFCTGTGRDEIGLFLRVRTHHPTNKSEFKVKYEGNTRGFHEFQSASIIISQNNGNRTTLNFGVNAGNGVRQWNVDLIDLGKVYSMLRWAWHYGYLATTGNYKRNLKVKVDSDVDGGFYRRSTNNLHLGMNIVDDIVQGTPGAEFVVYHEFGHFFMYGIIGDDKWTTPNGTSSTHTGTDNNFSDNMTMSEGTASGFAFILDEMTANVTDGESGRGWVSANYHERQRLDADLNTPFLSENTLARIMLDMWDGTGNNAVFGNPIGSAPVDQRRYFDDLNNGNGPQDNIELSFNTILSPFWENVGNINDLPTYFDRLVEKVDCQGKKDLRRVWLHNFSDHLNGGNPRAGVNPEDFMFLNTDVISEPISVTYVGNELEENDLGAIVVVSTNTINQTFTADVGEFDNNSTINVARSSISTFDFDFSDNLLIHDNSILDLNSSGQITFPMSIPSALNSIGNYSVCSDLIRIAENGTVRLGNDNSNARVGNVNFETGSELHIEGILQNPANLIVNENSTLVIEEGATLRIGPNNQIILDGPNAIIEIKGNLILEPGAEFKPVGGSNGIGRVIFDISGIQNGTQARERITVSTNSKMVFEATSNSTTRLEIRGQGLWLDDGGTNFSFTLKNAKAELAHDAMLNLGCKAVFEGAHVRKKAGAGFYRGVYLWGNPGHVVKNSSFQDGGYGLYYGSTKFGIRLNVEGSDFSNNWAGLQMLGGGISMKNSTLNSNSGYGMYAQGLLIPGKIFSSNFIDNGYRGLVYESNASAGMFVSGCNIKHNTDMGLKYISQGDLRIKCSHIEGLSGRVTPTGLEMFAGNLLVSSGRLGGLNLFRINNANIHSNDLWGAPVLFLDKGFNQFSSRVTTGDPENGLTGVVNMSSGAAGIPASQNRWDDRTTGSNSPVTVFGGSGFENYFLRDPFNGNLLVSDPNPLSASALTNALITSCVTEPTDNNKMMLYAGTGDNFPGDGPIINTYNFPNKTLGDAMDDVLNRGMDSLYDLSDLAGFWSEILAWGGYTVPVDAKTEFYLDLALNGALAVIGEHFATKGFVEPTDINDEMVQTVLHAFDSLASRVVNVSITDTFGFRLKNNVHLKKAHLLLTLDQLADATIVLNNMASWADAKTSAEVDYWLCQISNFNTLNADPYNYLKLDSLPSCLSGQQEAQATLTSDEQASAKFESVLNLYPNPAGKTLNLEYINKNEITAILKVEILDPVGKSIKSYENLNLTNGATKLDISSLASGTYFLRIQAGEQVYVRKLVVE